MEQKLLTDILKLQVSKLKKNKMQFPFHRPSVKRSNLGSFDALVSKAGNSKMADLRDG